MIHLIDKSALVAEIERRIKEHHSGYQVCLKDILSFLDTLEVKEVDFERELSKYVSNGIHRFFPNEGDDYYNMDSVVWQDYVIETAKHFFELGVRVNNPITAADRGMAEEIIVNLKRLEKDYRIDLTKEMEWLRNKVKKGEE